MSTTTPTTTKQLQCIKQGGPMKVVDSPYPTSVAPGHVLIRQKVVAFNKLDTKQRDYGILIEKWPHVLGLESAGVIEAVGRDVQGLRVGDEVVASAMGAFQERVVVSTNTVFKKPSNLSLEEAASLPTGFFTAIATIVLGAQIPLPILPSLSSSSEGKPATSVLVLGGSSVVGAAAIQLLRLAYPSLPIFATASPKHYDLVTSLGASKIVDYRSSSIVADLKSASGNGVDVILDCVGAGASQTDICDVFDPSGSKRYSALLTGLEVAVPEGVDKREPDGLQVLMGPLGVGLLPSLTKLVETGRYRAPLPVRVVGHGLEQIPEILDEVNKTSGEKLLCTL